MEENLQNKKYLTVKELIFYSLGLFGLQAIIFYINSYQVEFYSGSGMIEASKMVIVTFIILAAKLVSAVFDPLIGNLIDSKKGGKHGKLKPFIVISTIPLSILTVLIFCKVNLTGFALYSYIFVTTTLWSVAMTLGDVPSQGMSAVITPNPTERNNLIGFSGTLKSIGQAAPYVVVPAVCLCVPGGAGIEGTISTTEYLWCAIVISVLGSLMFLGIFFFNKERVPYEAERVSLKDMFGIIKNNKYLLLVVASYFLGFARQGAMAIQAQTANAILGGANKIIILGISTAVGTVISMAVTPILIKKFDEKKVFIAMSIYGGVSSVLAYLVAVWTNFNLVALIATLFLMGLQFGAVNIMPMIMVADSVDYYEWKTGKRTEGVAYAVLSLCIKVSLALGAAVCLAWVFADFTGYQANMTEFSDSVKKGVFFSYTVIPGITSALAAIPIFFYDLVGDKKKQISADLAARRGVVE